MTLKWGKNQQQMAFENFANIMSSITKENKYFQSNSSETATVKCSKAEITHNNIHYISFKLDSCLWHAVLISLSFSTSPPLPSPKIQMRSSQRRLGILPCFPHPNGQPVERSMWASQTASMSPSDQGIHCCSGSGYNFTTWPHPAPLVVHCCFEQSCLLMKGSMTWISRESCWRRRGEDCPGRRGGERGKKSPSTQPPFALELAVSVQTVSPCTTPS